MILTSFDIDQGVSNGIVDSFMLIINYSERKLALSFTFIIKTFIIAKASGAYV